MTVSSRTALVFPGQGAQFAGMGKDVYDVFAAAREIFDRADAALGFDISRLCFEGPEEELRLTENVQPAIVTFSLALLAAVRQSPRPLEAGFAAGHSLGEYSALSAAGAAAAMDAIILARKRGELMNRAGADNPGAMAAVIGLDAPAVETVCRETGVFIANYNSPGQIVISGAVANIEAASSMAADKGARKVVPLQVSGAFHTPLMAPAARGLASAISGVAWQETGFPVIANTTARPLHGVASIKKELTDQLTHPVKWQQSVETMAALGADTFVEIGPGKVLAGLIKRTNPAVKSISIGDADSLRYYIDKGLS